MPIPRSVARANRAGLNRVARRVAPHLPGFGVIDHRGRRSGREFATPVNVFAFHDGVRIALTYGPDSDWAKNVLAAGGCTLRRRGRTLRLVRPHVQHDPERSGLPAFGRFVLGRIHVDDFLDLDVEPAPDRAGDPA